jgi:hypothetical protein
MKVRVLVSLLLAILLFISSFAAGDYFTVDKEYNSVDTLQADDDLNAYRITVGSGKQIKYSFSVKSSYRILVFLAIGHSVADEFDYLIEYSADKPVRSYSNTFPVGSEDGTKFCLVVSSEEPGDITYEVDIEVLDTPLINYILAGLFIGLVIAILIGALVVRSKRQKKAQAERLSQKPKQPYVVSRSPETQVSEPEQKQPEPVEPIKTEIPPPPPQ